MNDLIRCIDTKTGKEKFMPPNIVKNKKLMATYNMIVQDNQENKKEVAEILNEPTNSDEFEVIETKRPRKPKE